MKLFIDTANVAHIREANELGVICGVTTNPSLIAKEGRDFKEVVSEITTIVDGPISAEVISMNADGMVDEARDLAKIHKNIVIKIPMCAEGLKAVKRLYSHECDAYFLCRTGASGGARRRILCQPVHRACG